MHRELNRQSKPNVKVSVLIVTYNQADYIKRAIESVICQKTDFQYEIIIYDDASSDGTSDIVREYSAQYDNVIPVIQEENQYSKGVFNGSIILKPYIKGTYVIHLDGDDYWCDEAKLQKQADFLDMHPDYVAHTHSVRHIFPSGKTEYFPLRSGGEWTPQEIIDWGNVFHLSSLMYRSELFLYEFDGIPAFPAYDYILACRLIFHGKIAYSEDVMSVHVLFAKGSFTESNFNVKGDFKTSDTRLKNLDDRETLIHKLDELSGYNYHDLFVYSQERRLADYYTEIEDYRGIIRDCREFVRRKKLKSRVWLYGRVYTPWLVCIYEKIRKRFGTRAN